MIMKKVLILVVMSLFTIGAFAASHGSLFANANISQVHVYNRVLSASEVQQNYLATKGRYQ